MKYVERSHFFLCWDDAAGIFQPFVSRAKTSWRTKVSFHFFCLFGVAYEAHAVSSAWHSSVFGEKVLIFFATNEEKKSLQIPFLALFQCITKLASRWGKRGKCVAANLKFVMSTELSVIDTQQPTCETFFCKPQILFPQIDCLHKGKRPLNWNLKEMIQRRFDHLPVKTNSLTFFMSSVSSCKLFSLCCAMEWRAIRRQQMLRENCFNEIDN